MALDSIDLETMPGYELVKEGLTDLESGRPTLAALLVSIGHPRLVSLGLNVPPPLPEPEGRLYVLLREKHGDGAHSRYNALVRRLVSFEHAVACAK